MMTWVSERTFVRVCATRENPHETGAWLWPADGMVRPCRAWRAQR